MRFIKQVTWSNLFSVWRKHEPRHRICLWFVFPIWCVLGFSGLGGGWIKINLQGKRATAVVSHRPGDSMSVE